MSIRKCVETSVESDLRFWLWVFEGCDPVVAGDKQQRSRSTLTLVDGGDYTPVPRQLPPAQMTDVVFRIVFGRMSKRTWMGDLHVKDLDFMMQSYRVLPLEPRVPERQSEQTKRAFVLPAQAELSGAAWFLGFIWRSVHVC